MQVEQLREMIECSSSSEQSRVAASIGGAFLALFFLLLRTTLCPVLRQALIFLLLRTT